MLCNVGRCMKRFSRVVFLCSIVMVSGIFGMETTMPVRQSNWFVGLKNTVIERYAGKNIRYYDEYHANRSNEERVSFPVECTDHLPIEYCGEIKYFITSATRGKEGGAYMILDPKIKRLAVVRGVVDNKNVRIYMGFNTNIVKECGYEGRDRFYPARVMMLQIKEKNASDRGYWYRNYRMPLVELFGAQQIKLEVEKGLLSSDCDWKNPEMQAAVKKLLGEKRVQDFNFEKPGLCPQKMYWTDTENRLKGIKYRPDHK